MTITVQDPVNLGSAPAVIGGAVPTGTVRVFKSVGVHNDTGAPVTLQVWLVAKDGAPDATNKLINRAIPDGETDLCPELLGRGLKVGGTLQMQGLNMNAGFTAIDSIA